MVYLDPDPYGSASRGPKTAAVYEAEPSLSKSRTEGAGEQQVTYVARNRRRRARSQIVGFHASLASPGCTPGDVAIRDNPW